MPQGDKSAYTSKQKRQAEHIEDSYESRGVSSREAERRAWATVNKQTGGGLKKKASTRKKTGGSRATKRTARSRRGTSRKAKS